MPVTGFECKLIDLEQETNRDLGSVCRIRLVLWGAQASTLLLGWLMCLESLLLFWR